jgi:uncharacterized protein
MKPSLETRWPSAPIPASAGIGLRGPHHARFLHERPPARWLEAHSENYFAPHGVARDALLRLRRDYAVSLHGVGLSLGSAEPLDGEHLERLRALAAALEPGLVSEHLSWGAVGGRHTNDLLPLPYTEEALDHMVARVAYVQDFLRRRILIENVSSYLQFTCSSVPEWEFLVALAERSGCGILLDVNNVYVSAVNHGFDAGEYLAAVPAELVGEIHLAGHSVEHYADEPLLIDTHDAPVHDDVWRLYAATIRRIGAVPTLIEWDASLPSVEALLAEADKAEAVLEVRRAVAA